MHFSFWGLLPQPCFHIPDCKSLTQSSNKTLQLHSKIALTSCSMCQQNCSINRSTKHIHTDVQAALEATGRTFGSSGCVKLKTLLIWRPLTEDYRVFSEYEGQSKSSQLWEGSVPHGTKNTVKQSEEHESEPRQFCIPASADVSKQSFLSTEQTVSPQPVGGHTHNWTFPSFTTALV